MFMKVTWFKKLEPEGPSSHTATLAKTNRKKKKGARKGGTKLFFFATKCQLHQHTLANHFIIVLQRGCVVCHFVIVSLQSLFPQVLFAPSVVSASSGLSSRKVCIFTKI